MYLYRTKEILLCWSDICCCKISVCDALSCKVRCYRKTLSQYLQTNFLFNVFIIIHHNASENDKDTQKYCHVIFYKPHTQHMMFSLLCTNIYIVFHCIFILYTNFSFVYTFKILNRFSIFFFLCISLHVKGKNFVQWHRMFVV